MDELKAILVNIFTKNHEDFLEPYRLNEINSIKLIELLVIVEQRFDIEFDDMEYISNFKTIDDVCERVSDLLREKEYTSGNHSHDQ